MVLPRSFPRASHTAGSTYARGHCAQLGAYAVLSDPAFAGKLPLFGGVEKSRFRRQVVPGDVLELEVTLGRMSARAGKGSGRAHVGGETAAETELLFVFADA